jgi:hypothetical protein
MLPTKQMEFYIHHFLCHQFSRQETSMVLLAFFGFLCAVGSAWMIIVSLAPSVAAAAATTALEMSTSTPFFTTTTRMSFFSSQRRLTQEGIMDERNGTFPTVAPIALIEQILPPLPSTTGTTETNTIILPAIIVVGLACILIVFAIFLLMYDLRERWQGKQQSRGLSEDPQLCLQKKCHEKTSLSSPRHVLLTTTNSATRTPRKTTSKNKRMWTPNLGMMEPQPTTEGDTSAGSDSGYWVTTTTTRSEKKSNSIQRDIVALDVMSRVSTMTESMLLSPWSLDEALPLETSSHVTELSEEHLVPLDDSTSALATFIRECMPKEVSDSPKDDEEALLNELNKEENYLPMDSPRPSYDNSPSRYFTPTKDYDDFHGSALSGNDQLAISTHKTPNKNNPDIEYEQDSPLDFDIESHTEV